MWRVGSEAAYLFDYVPVHPDGAHWDVEGRARCAVTLVWKVGSLEAHCAERAVGMPGITEGLGELNAPHRGPKVGS